MKKTLIEIFGWYGTTAIVAAYILITFSVIQPGSFWYQFLNGTGAIGILVISLYKKNYQPAVLNIVWLSVAIIAIINVLR